MDTYASVNPSYSKGKAYFCEGCVGMKAREVYERANFFPSGNGYPQICIGCAHTSALKHQSFVANHQELVDAFRLSTDFSLVVFASRHSRQSNAQHGERPNSWLGTGHTTKTELFATSATKMLELRLMLNHEGIAVTRRKTGTLQRCIFSS